MNDSTQSSQEHIASGHTIYTTAADSMIQDYTGSKLSRSYSDSYLLNGSFTSQTVDSTGELLFYSQIHSPANSNSSQFYSLPHIPQNVDDHLPSADVLLPQVPQSDSFSSSSDDECSQKQHLNLMLPGDQEIDHSSKYLTLKRGTNMPFRSRSHSLNADYFVPSYETPPPSSSCADINSTVSDESKQAMSGLCVDEASNSGNELSSLQPTNHYDNRQQERLLSSEVSNSDSSVNISSLNQEVYTFVANSLNPKGDEKCETSLDEILQGIVKKNPYLMIILLKYPMKQ